MANPNPKTDHLEKWQFKPGESGNPKGVPKPRRVWHKVMRLLETPHPDNKGETLEDYVLRAYVGRLLEGDMRAFTEFFNRTDGKPIERIVAQQGQFQIVIREATKPKPVEDPDDDG